MTYNDALNIIKHKQSLGIKPGLSRIKALLEIMGNPQNEYKIIHIAGTNGKGTIANTIANALSKLGYKVGLFTSPWIIDYREQIQINNEFISRECLADYIEKYYEYDATEFEMLTAIMYKYFADSNVDYAVVECGMGGLEDSTNVEKDNISVITSISLDHTNFLGNTVTDIARHKAGIIRDNSLCVLYPNAEVEKYFEDVCRQKNTKLIKIRDQDNYQLNNLNTAMQVIISLGFDCQVDLVIPCCRCENVNGIILDGGHNTSAGKALLNSINHSETAIIGMLKDKDVDSYLSIVAPRCKKIIAVTPDNPRAMSADDLAKIAEKYCNDVCVCDDIEKALTDNNITLVCGSFFLTRQLRKFLINN